MVNKIKKYIIIWWFLTIETTQIAFVSRFGALLFLLGKVVRFIFFLVFLLLIASRTKLIAGYTLWEMIFFFLTFNLVDLLPQFFLREVYRFRRHIVTGYFDHYLTKPLPVLFRSLFGGSDALDIPMIFLSLITLGITIPHLPHVTVFTGFLYCFLLLNALTIALAFHIFVLALGILTTEVDNTMMFYRNLTQMGRVPVDIYTQPIRGILTFAVPVGIMMTVPAKALLGLLTPVTFFAALAISALFLSCSLYLWKYALRRYASASS